MWRLLAKEMGFDDPAFQMTGSELYAECIKWDAPQMGGADVAHFKRYGFLRIDVGAPNTCAPHAQGSFPTPSGEAVDPLPGYVPPRETSQTNPLRAEHRLAEEPWVRQLLLRQ